MRIVQEGTDRLAEYESVPIAFEITSRLCLDNLRRGILVAIPTEPQPKNYDTFPEERPTSLPSHFDMTDWGIFAALEGNQRLGGIIIACGAESYPLLEGRDDLAFVVDLRVRPSARGQGVGTMLIEHAVTWTRLKSCVELRVETQDTNVAACRLYAAMGAHVHSIEEGGYGPDLDEARIIWRLASKTEPAL